jgi:hypothetical protein
VELPLTPKTPVDVSDQRVMVLTLPVATIIFEKTDIIIRPRVNGIRATIPRKIALLSNTCIQKPES